MRRDDLMTRRPPPSLHPTRRVILLGALAATTGLLLAVTIAMPDWIETVFSVDPDRGNGSLEWLVVTALAIAFISFAGATGIQWRRTLAHPAPPHSG
jgi:hypothetical protein